MKKKVIGIIAAIVVVPGLSLDVYNQIIPNEYVPADDEIALYQTEYQPSPVQPF